MKQDLTDCLEQSIAKVNGVAVILDIFAGAPDVVRLFTETGDAFTVLCDALTEAKEAMEECLSEEL